VAATMIYPGLVGAWVFNKFAGDRVPDLSGNGNHGTIINTSSTVSWVRTSRGQALRMTGGSSDRVDLGTITSRNPLVCRSGLTIIADVLLLSTGSGTFQAIVDKSLSPTSDEPLNGYGLKYSRIFNTIEGSIDDKNLSGSYNANNIENRWTRLAFTYRPLAIAKTYRDRAIRMSTNTNFNKVIPDTEAPMAIGNGATGARTNLAQLNGDIRSVFIFNRELTPLEVATFSEDKLFQRSKRYAFTPLTPSIVATYARSRIIDGD